MCALANPVMRLAALMFLGLFLGLLVSCQKTPAQFTGETMGTVYSVLISDTVSADQITHLQAEIQRALDEVNALMSTYIADSEISLFNQSRSVEWQTVSSAFAEVVAAGREISVLSEGAFDMTVAPLVNLWGFGPEQSVFQPPSDDAVKAQLERVGYERLEVRKSPPGLRKSLPDLSVDLSAIAKGYAVDKMAETLEAGGISNFLVEIGGELYGKGINAEGKPWQIGIEYPDSGAYRGTLGIVNLSGYAIATSGDYKNYFEYEGRRYSHEIDTRTGKPVDHRTVSVSVIADDAMRADAWATALLVMGSRQGSELAQELGIAAYFIDRIDRIDSESETFKALSNSAFDRFLVKQP